MREKGILIRSMENKKDIGKSIRVSIGTKEQMIFFLGQLQGLRFNKLITKNINCILIDSFRFYLKVFPNILYFKIFHIFDK